MSLRELYAAYSQYVQFLMIYIREAHPIDGWDVGSKYRTRDPVTIEERRKAANDCETALQYGIKTYVDEMHDPVMMAYVAWPERLYLVDIEGHIAYAGKPGPWGFSPAELKVAIEEVLIVTGKAIPEN
ncbi:hypothetical protein KFU94_60955 [Chloroflexi bacterium TSY]|nr:hypothetical protein [Chloroflexi bacterium TSY]